MGETSFVVSREEKTIAMTRVLNAPRRVVWDRLAELVEKLQKEGGNK